MRRAYYVCLYYLSWLVFGLVGLALNVVCAVLLLAPRREAFGPAVRRVIRALFDFWTKWLNATGIVRVDFRGFQGPITGGVVVVANHPTLIDATVLLARMPDAICVFKPALMRNPVVGPAAIMAGYAAGDAGVDTMRAAAERVLAGRSLLIFPEGTRTEPGLKLGPLKAGFALIAARARAPVQLVSIAATEGLMARGRPWWKCPRHYPAFVSATLDRRWDYHPGRHASVLVAEVERRILEISG